MPNPDMSVINKRNFLNELGEPNTPEEYIARRIFMRVQYEYLKDGQHNSHGGKIITAIEKGVPGASSERGQLRVRKKHEGPGSIPGKVQKLINRAKTALGRLVKAYEGYLENLPEPDPIPDPYANPKYDPSGQGLLPFNEALDRILGI